MSRRRKKKKQQASEPEPSPSAEVGTSLKSLLAHVDLRADEPAPKKEKKPSKRALKKAEEDAAKRAAVKRRRPPEPTTPEPSAPRPSSGLVGDDKVRFQQAMAGVRSLESQRAKKKKKKQKGQRVSRVPPTSAEDAQVRQRLASLVGGGVRFQVDTDREGYVAGLRAGEPASLLDELSSKHALVEARLDLHGYRGDAAEAEVARFVRRCRKQSLRRVAIVHGRGHHSEGGVGVLGDRVVHALSEGGAAPLVRAFRTAARELGGLGVLMVELVRR